MKQIINNVKNFSIPSSSLLSLLALGACGSNTQIQRSILSSESSADAAASLYEMEASLASELLPSEASQSALLAQPVATDLTPEPEAAQNLNPAPSEEAYLSDADLESVPCSSLANVSIERLKQLSIQRLVSCGLKISIRPLRSFGIEEVAEYQVRSKILGTDAAYRCFFRFPIASDLAAQQFEWSATSVVNAGKFHELDHGQFVERRFQLAHIEESAANIGQYKFNEVQLACYSTYHGAMRFVDLSAALEKDVSAQLLR